jgi:plastocyanin
LASSTKSSAHEDHGTFSAGRPGDPKKPGRVVKVNMFEGSGKMGFEPARIEVRRGEQIRLVLHNDGEEDHEFVLATVGENRKHAEVMKKHPDMEHADPNGKRILPHGFQRLSERYCAWSRMHGSTAEAGDGKKSDALSHVRCRTQPHDSHACVE